jgi:hypothetical protein
MAEAKSFNNVIIGQFVLTGVPIKVYVDGRYLTITDVDDVEDPTMGFGMDENGSMHHFNYLAVERLLVQGNEVTLDTYNKGMEDKFKGDEEPASGKEEKPEDKGGEEKKGIFGKKKEESIMKLKDMIKEISQEEVDAEVEAAEMAIDAAKAKEKAAKAAVKDTIKKSKEKIKAAQSQPIEEDREADSMLHSILSLAGKADGEGMAEIAYALGVNADFYDLEDDSDLDDLYDDIENSLKQVSSSEISKVYNELQKMNLVEGHNYTFGVGDIVKNKNTSCPHHGSMGIVKDLIDSTKGTVAIYTVTNVGPTYKPGDSLAKTVDQLVPIQTPDDLEGDM